MKIQEIITVNSSQPSVEIDEKELTAMKSFFADAKPLKLPHGLEVRDRSDSFYRWLGIFKNGDIFGWAKLKPTKVAGVDVHAVELVYLVPKYRKSAAAGWIFLYAKDLVGTPITLGDEDSYGGVAFKDGEDLIAALKRTGKFELSLVNLKSGEKQPLSLPLKDHRFTTVMIESLVDFTVVDRLAEAHAVPGSATTAEYQQTIDWLGGVEP